MKQIKSLDWLSIRSEIEKKGFVLIPKILSDEDCQNIKQNYSKPMLYRKTVVMQRHRFGLGEYKYFDYPLPVLIQKMRETIYPKLAPIANQWMKALKIDKEFPSTFEELQKLCWANNQRKSTVLILKYGNGGFNTLHQDLYGEIFFPLQCAVFLSEPEVDFHGGEFVLTEQIPRAQSKATVLQPKKGDMLIFTTNFRPEIGVKGYYRVNMKHGVSQVKDGERFTLGIIFHDAVT